MRRLAWTIGLAAAVVSDGIARGADVLPPAAQRFAEAGRAELPDFQRHVSPLLGRLGCNGRACHGSFQGQAGFRLSLFGYDFNIDHTALTGAGQGGEPRVNIQEPLESLILRKATAQEDHRGGKRMDSGSWEFQLLQRWIAGGAQPAAGGAAAGASTDAVNSKPAARLVKLEVQPAEALLTPDAQKTRLTVIAHWDDDSAEDVTCLTRFRSNDDSVVAIDADGLASAVGPGATHLVAFYDNGVASVPAIVPVSNPLRGDDPDVPAPTKVDALVARKLRQMGIVPSELTDDAAFLRRVSLDIAGTQPTAGEVESFLADPAPDKRDRKVNELLETPAYAAWWATKLCDTMGNNKRRIGTYNIVLRDYARLWYEWVAARIAENTPYDQLVERMVVATGRQPGQTYLDYCREMSSYVRSDAPADHAQRRTVPYYWERRYVSTAEDYANGFAHAFLGLRIDCARCHKHPFDQWTQQDFQHFAAFFAKIDYSYADGDTVLQSRQMLKELNDANPDATLPNRLEAALTAGKPLPFREVCLVPSREYRPRNAAGALSDTVVPPRLLGAAAIVEQNQGDPRQVLMDWMRRRDNPYFARAFVNRVWAAYFGVGIIDPPDDQNLANPPSHPELLDYLVEGFIDSRFDMKWLHRQIACSRTYQLSWHVNATNQDDRRHFSRALVRRLPAEVAYDAIRQATVLDRPPLITEYKAIPDALRPFSIGRLDGLQRAIASTPDGDDRRPHSVHFLDIFGKPDRLQTCDCERADQTTLMQLVYMHNDDELLQWIEDSPWIKQSVNEGDPEASVRQAYLRTLSRPPTESERARARQHLAEIGNAELWLQDLLWALLNTKEFLTNH